MFRANPSSLRGLSKDYSKPARRIDSPDCYCVVDVLLYMVFTHSADLSVKVSIVMYSDELDERYHIMREDCLGLRFSKQVQHCCRC